MTPLRLSLFDPLAFYQYGRLAHRFIAHLPMRTQRTFVGKLERFQQQHCKTSYIKIYFKSVQNLYNILGCHEYRIVQIIQRNYIILYIHSFLGGQRAFVFQYSDKLATIDDSMVPVAYQLWKFFHFYKYTRAKVNLGHIDIIYLIASFEKMSCYSTFMCVSG